MADGRRLFRPDRPTVGFGVGDLAGPTLLPILAAAGVDYVLVDLEHSSFTLRDVAALVASARGVDLPLIVRPPEIGRGWVSRLLDIGADGILAPRVETARDAADLVRFGKYPPLGDRGDSGRIYAARPRSREAAEEANALTVLMVIVETAAGAGNADEICATTGIDAVWIGHADLSLSLGVTGDLESEAYRAAEAGIIEACRRQRMPFTIGVAPDPEIALEQARLGCFTIFVDDEITLIGRVLSRYVTQFRAGLG